MGWDGAGGYTRQHNFSADASSGIKILAARMDAELDDFASAMTVALARNGQNVPTGNMPMGGFRHINVGAPTSVGNYMRVREFIENVPIFMDDQQSSADRISVSAQYFTSVSANQAPGDGTRILVRVNSNKSSAVLYLNGHSANVEHANGVGLGAALTSGGVYEFIYSSVHAAWQVAAPDSVFYVTSAETSAGLTPSNFNFPPGHRYRYLSSFDRVETIYYQRTAGEISNAVTPTDYGYKPGDVRRYGVTGSGDEQAKLQNALNSGEKVVDGQWIACTSNSSLTVPAGVEFRNVSITAGTAGINLVLLNTGCKLSGKLTGTGTLSTVERLVYPAAQGVTDVELDVEVTNATYGVHIQPTSGTAVADRPKRWKGFIYAHDIVGTVGDSEGYGLLMSPAENCNFVLHAKSIARHAVYLGAGARYNKIVAHVDDCDNYAAQLYSTSAQDATEQNDITVFAQNLDETVAGQGGAVAIVQKAHRNRVMVYHDGDGTTSYSVLVEGDSGGPYPLGNEIGGKITGQFTGQDVIRMLNADSTKILPGTDIRAYATADVIGMRHSGTNGSVHGGYVEGVFIDAQGQNIKGIYNEINTVPSYIGPCDIRNNGSAARVDDQTSGWREGFSRSCRFSGTTASITAGAVGDTSATLVRDIATTRRSAHVRITDSSVGLSNNSGVVRVGTPADSTHVDFRIFNAHASDQTFNYEGVVYGD